MCIVVRSTDSMRSINLAPVDCNVQLSVAKFDDFFIAVFAFRLVDAVDSDVVTARVLLLVVRLSFTSSNLRCRFRISSFKGVIAWQ